MNKEVAKVDKKKDGYSVVSSEKRLFFPTAELMNIGCRNCVWEGYSQCPHKIKPKEGICSELIQFLFSLSEPDDSVSAVWEKFYIYKTRLQEAADHKDFLDKQKEINLMEKRAKSQEDYDNIDKIKMEKTAAKMWWVKLNQQVVFSLQKVVDREQKKGEGGKMPGILSASTINFHIAQKDVKSIENNDEKK